MYKLDIRSRPLRLLFLFRPFFLLLITLSFFPNSLNLSQAFLSCRLPPSFSLLFSLNNLSRALVCMWFLSPEVLVPEFWSPTKYYGGSMAFRRLSDFRAQPLEEINLVISGPRFSLSEKIVIKE